MMNRSANLQVLIALAERAIMARADGRTRTAAARVFERLAGREGTSAAIEAQRLPICHHQLDAAFSAMAAEPSPLPEIAAAFSALEGRLHWERRRSSRPEDGAFDDGHANATIIGPGGIEQREDVWVGITLMAPDITYPDHSHPPEEVYLAFTSGEWWNAAMDWTEPGPAGLIYNPPGILHAMRSGSSAFLAMWFLPVD